MLTTTAEEAVIDEPAGQGLFEYSELMEACFREFHRVLKPGRWMTVEFSNSSNAVWSAIQQALASAGFVVADTRVLDKEQHSFRQVTAKNAVKRDLIISAYKPHADGRRARPALRRQRGQRLGVRARAPVAPAAARSSRREFRGSSVSARPTGCTTGWSRSTSRRASSSR